MSGPQVYIAGFPTTDKTPGPYGEVVYGAGGNSGASAPLTTLLVGLRGVSSGNLTTNTEIRQVWSLADIDAAAGPGQELATMGYDALAVAPGAPLYMLAPANANGAVAATAALTISGTPTGSGTINVRVAGVVVGTQVQVTDTAATIATNIAANVNGAALGRLPVTAAASSGQVTFSCSTAGVRGMQHVLFLDMSQGPSGITAGWYTTWAASTTYAITAPIAFVVPKASPNGYYYKATAMTTGTSGASEPTWPTTVGTTVVDSGVTWTCWGSTATSSSAVIGVFLGSGTGTETYTVALQTLANIGFGRIGLAANDATSLAAWATQITAQAAVLVGLRQHAIFGTNGTLTAATTLSGSTVNSQRFQQVWQLNSETHPSRMSAALAALATVTEQNDPAAMYDGVAVSTIVPQSQKPDWPVHATLVSALNGGVTPMFTYGDGLARICRGITTHCLSAGNADYSTLDTAQARCPDYVLGYLMGYWTGTFLPANPRVQPDPQTSDPRPPGGVAYPDLWSSTCTGVLSQMIAGKIPGTCPPILIPNANGAVCNASYDTNAKRIMTAVPITVAPGNHQVGISVRQLA